jgi:hypothetical protein
MFGSHPNVLWSCILVVHGPLLVVKLHLKVTLFFLIHLYSDY